MELIDADGAAVTSMFRGLLLLLSIDDEGERMLLLRPSTITTPGADLRVGAPQYDDGDGEDDDEEEDDDEDEDDDDDWWLSFRCSTKVPPLV